MKRRISIFSLCLSLIIFCCKNNYEVNAPLDKDIILEYKSTSGWTNFIISMSVFIDKTAIKRMDGKEFMINFSEVENKQIDILISEFPGYVRTYKPINSIWMDINTYELICKNSPVPDTVSIFEPLDTEGIPESLVELIRMFEKK